MSAVVKTITPFIDKECLLKSLQDINCKYILQNEKIITERTDYYGHQLFVFQNGKYQFQHDSSANFEQYDGIYGYRKNSGEYKTVNAFLSAVEKAYQRIYKEKLAELERQRLEAERKRQEQLIEQERLRLEAEAKRIEEEKRRLEQERKAFVESQKKAIIAKAKQKGYAIQETYVKNKVKLVLVKNTY